MNPTPIDSAKPLTICGKPVIRSKAIPPSPPVTLLVDGFDFNYRVEAERSRQESFSRWGWYSEEEFSAHCLTQFLTQLQGKLQQGEQAVEEFLKGEEARAMLLIAEERIQ